MRVDLFDFDLPETSIALRPAKPRDAAQMLLVESDGTLSDKTVLDLPDLLEPGDALVFNNTKVIPAQLQGVRTRNGVDAQIGATLHMRVGLHQWRAFLKPAKKVKAGETIVFSSGVAKLTATLEEKYPSGDVLLAFDHSGADLDAALHQVGVMPLPPYIAGKRGEDAQDREDYQTVYAEEEGAVAAPTAGLHFTDRLFDALDARGIERHFVTLHVGAGTFLPVKVDDTAEHHMHSEIGYLSQETVDALLAVKERGNRVIAVGTTSLRLLESAAVETGTLAPWSGASDIFITPGFRFKAIDGLMTNFHLPRSTLFMLVSAFSGLDTMQAAYAHAIKSGYRFYSYGDSSLLWPQKCDSQKDKI